MPRAKGPERPRQFHVIIDECEDRQIRVVAAEEGRTISDLFRDIFVAEVNRRYEAITGRGTKARKAL